MRIVMKLLFILSLVVMPILAGQLDEASYNRGEMLFLSKGCSSCHGAEAEGSTMYPRLANKPAKYLKGRIEKFKAGKTDTPSEQMMAQFVEKLLQKQIADLVYFLSHHKKAKETELDDDLLGGFGS